MYIYIYTSILHMCVYTHTICNTLLYNVISYNITPILQSDVT